MAGPASFGLPTMLTAQMQDIVRFDDPSLDIPIRERADALDGWLEDAAPSEWAQLKQEWRIPDVRTAPVRQLWSMFLASTHVARAVAEPTHASVRSRVADLAGNPIRIAQVLPIAGGWLLELPTDHPAIRSDLRTVAHPSISGAMLAGVDPSQVTPEVVSTIAKALEHIGNASAELLGLVRTHCGAICLVRAEPALEPGQCVSLTSKLIPGIVYVSPVPVILMAESIVHEAAHLCLASAERRQSLYVDSNRRIMTPLRPDPRPISGLMHQVWVLLHLEVLYRALLANPSEAVVRNLGPVKKRLELHSDGLTQGLSALRSASDGLTPAGMRLVEAISAAGAR